MIKGSKKPKVIKALPYFKEYKKANKLSYADLSDITGYSETTLSNFTNGKPVSKGVVQVLARELEINQALIAEVVEA